MSLRLSGSIDRRNLNPRGDLVRALLPSAWWGILSTTSGLRRMHQHQPQRQLSRNTCRILWLNEGPWFLTAYDSPSNDYQLSVGHRPVAALKEYTVGSSMTTMHAEHLAESRQQKRGAPHLKRGTKREGF
jgi:hypothetical protein